MDMTDAELAALEQAIRERIGLLEDDSEPWDAIDPALDRPREVALLNAAWSKLTTPPTADG